MAEDKTNPVTKEELKELIEKLGGIRGRHTELVTVFVPEEYNLNFIVTQLESEKSTAKNIKSTGTRKNVIESLEKITRQLKLMNRTPKNGIALFAGNVSETEGQTDIQLWAIEPPEPLTLRLYRCDQVFVLDPLKDMLEAKEVFGLFVLDRKEATIAILEGKRVNILQKIESGVPGKIRAGGQCLSPDTLIMSNDGDILEIKDTHNPQLILSENFNKEQTEETPVIVKWENNKPLFKVITHYPRIEIKASKDHTFFVRTEKGIEEKILSEISEGDYLIMPEKINLDLEDQVIDFSQEIKQRFNMKNVVIPKKITPLFAKILGYYLGDGAYEKDRLTFFEQRKEVADYYKKLLEDIFGIEVKCFFRKDKNYYQLRVYSRIISQLFKSIFRESDKTMNEKIPSIILMSSDKSLASFIKGFFDAEGYVSSSKVAIGINNKGIIKQLQLCLLRLGIVSSFLEYDNKGNPYSNNPRYTLEISDFTSIKKFIKFIGFSSKEKHEKLFKLLKQRSSMNRIRQLVVNGKDVARILKNSGLHTNQFNMPNFFVNKRQISKEIFKKNILDKIDDITLKERLRFIYNSNLIITKVFKIEPLDISRTIDIETKNHNFIANGLIVHNSANRYRRVIEGKAKDFFKKCAEALKDHFFDLKNLAGIIIGGPMPTKDDFLREGGLVTALKDKIVGMKDIGYADEHGIDLLVEISDDILKEQEITYEKKLLENFFNMLGKQRDKTAYGLEPVKKALGVAAVDTLLLSKKLQKSEIEDLVKLAGEIGSKIEYVSVETEEGQQFWNLSGIGAILRYSIAEYK